MFALLLVIIAGCSNEPDMDESISDSRFYLGTVISVQLFGTEDESLIDGSFELIADVEDTMSINIEESEVIDVNNMAGIEPVQVSDDTFYVIEKALHYAQLSEGKFDISMEPVIKLWGIGSETPRIPSDEELTQALSHVNYKDVILDEENHTVYLSHEDMAIDLGGIAKGFAADKVATYLEEQGITKAILNLGGNVMAVGEKHPGEGFKVGLQNPFESRNTYFGIVDVAEKTVVTSGIYERNFTQDGVTYHHILSTTDGYPVTNGLAAVSVVADHSIDADALSTTLFVLGVQDGLALVAELDGVDCAYVTMDQELYLSEGMRDIFNLTDDGFTLAN